MKNNIVTRETLRECVKVIISSLHSPSGQFAKYFALFEKAKVNEINTGFASRLANLYESLPNEPKNQLVQRAYFQMVTEMYKQHHIFTTFFPKFVIEQTLTDQYKNSSEMFADVSQGHMYVLKSESDNFDTNNILLQKSTVSFDNQKYVSYNDLFRFLHDLFGHCYHLAQFGPIGEETAYRSHAAMFSQMAVHALTTETRLQNSWVNFWANHQELPVKERPFAPQKNYISPLWAMELY